MRKIVGIAAVSLAALGSVLVGASAASADGHHRPNHRPQAPVAAVQIQAIRYDAPGRDNRSNQSLNGEWVSVVNNGRRPVNLRGYELSDRGGFHTYQFGNVWLERGESIRVHTGNGRNNDRAVFWRSGNHIWNNDGDTATLSGPRGRTVDTCSYRVRNGNGRGIVRC